MSATTYAPAAPRDGAVSRRDLLLARRQVRYELRALWRNRTRMFFILALPILFLALFGALNGGGRVHGDGHQRVMQYLVPGLLSYGVVMATFTTLATGTALLREKGILKRIAGTPLPGWIALAGRVGASACVAAVMAVLCLGIGAAAYGVSIRFEGLPAVVVTLVLAVAGLSGLGIGIARFIPNADTGPAIVNAVVLPLTFISGVWGPSDGEPQWLQHIAGLFPLEHLAHSLRVAMDPATHGAGLVGSDLLVLAIWAVVGARMTIRFLATRP